MRRRWVTGFTGLLAAVLGAPLLTGGASAAPAHEDGGTAAWGSPTRISDRSSGDADLSGPLVALAPEGDVTIVWSRNDWLLSRTRQAGGSWGPVVRVGTGYPGDIDVDAAGNVTVVWARHLPGDRRLLFTSTRPDGGAWSPPHRLSRVPQRRGVYLGVASPDLDVNARGDAVATWDYGSEHVGRDWITEASYRRSGAAWGPRARLGPEGSHAQGGVVGPDGLSTVLLRHDRRLAGFQWVRGGWRPAGSQAVSGFDEAGLAVSARTGRVLAHWSASRRGPHGYRYVVRGSWLEPDGWTPPRTLTKRRSGWGSVAAIDSLDTATVAWSTPRGGVQVARWTRAQPPERPVTLAQRRTGLASMTVAADGTAVVAWAWPDPATHHGYRVRVARRPPAGPWSAHVTVSGRRQIEPGSVRLGAWPGGQAAVTWLDRRGNFAWLASG